MEQIDKVIESMEGKRVKYKDLIQWEEPESLPSLYEQRLEGGV